MSRPRARYDLDLSLQGEILVFGYRAPEDAERVEVEIELYPLYTDYRGQGWDDFELVDYYSWNSRHHNPAGRFEDRAEGYVELQDRHGRVPKLAIEAPNGTDHAAGIL